MCKLKSQDSRIVEPCNKSHKKNRWKPSIPGALYSSSFFEQLTQVLTYPSKLEIYLEMLKEIYQSWMLHVANLTFYDPTRIHKILMDLLSCLCDIIRE